MSAPRPVAIVVLTWNALAHTQRCIRSLQHATAHPSWRLIVVDNGSTDGTVEWLRTQSGVTVVENGRNLGFSRGCNIGIGACRGDEDVVLMNNDTMVLDPDWLGKLQAVAYSDGDVGVVGARLVDGHGQVVHAGSYMQPVSFRGQQLGGLELDINQATRDRPVESVVFAQVYLRRDCLERVGPLDEDLFAYFEDSDYCIRAQRAGFRVVCAGRVSTVHNQSTSTRENKVDFWTIYERSRKVFKKKWEQWLDERYESDVVWHSVVHEPLGYAVQSRKLMAAMHFAGLRVAYRNAYGGTDRPTRDLLVDDLLQRRPTKHSDQIAFCQADAFGRVTGRHKVGWTMLEVTGLPPAWVDGCNRMDEVWVPASFNVETFRRSGVTVPIHVMPLGVDVDYYHPRIAGYRPSRRFTFLSVFEWGERKAPEVLLRAFAEEFKQSEDVLLVLSVFNRDPLVDVEAEVAKVDLPPCPPIAVLVNPQFADYQMGALYRSADCFVLPSRGEGWGMTVLEAMACGLPVIATGWGGPADFLHEAVSYPLDWSLVPARARCPYYAGFEWAEPDHDHLRFLMRQVYDDPAAAALKGQAAAQEVAARYSWEEAARRVKARLQASA
ncbi:MAG TPA: glycosyltransferase [Acidimicrobiales bacterium]|nr:glycosyltransferase [Acidimicrobiales bacterium]